MMNGRTNGNATVTSGIPTFKTVYFLNNAAQSSSSTSITASYPLVPSGSTAYLLPSTNLAANAQQGGYARLAFRLTTNNNYNLTVYSYLQSLWSPTDTSAPNPFSYNAPVGISSLNPAGAFSYVNLDVQGGQQVDYMNAWNFNNNGLLLVYANPIAGAMTVDLTLPAPYIEAVVCESPAIWKLKGRY